MCTTKKLAGFLVSVIFCATALAEQGGRPRDLTLSNFQFGPVNRWAFSNLREVLPTANIEHDGDRVLVLHRSNDYVDDFSLDFEGPDRPIDAIAESQYIDGLLILKNGEIVFEKYYGHLTEARGRTFKVQWFDPLTGKYHESEDKEFTTGTCRV